MDATADRVERLLQAMSLEEKVQLVQGVDFWTTAAIDSIGLRAMTLSDGPSGVRGPRWDERMPSLNLPSGSALGASWDVDIAARYGAASAVEARRKGVDVVLGPTINLHRSPLGGRHFECLSEDPELTAEMGAAYVRGLQALGVAATPKHYVANDSETDRFTVDVQVDERTLRELYLIPFERAVEAGAWAVMSAYNAVNGVTMTEHDLLRTPLDTEWGFDGVVISDWTAVRSLEAASAAQDLAMPGPHTAWSELAEAIRDGRVEAGALDRKVRRILRLAERVGALDGEAAEPAPPFDGIAFAREASVAGSVLLSNDGLLPLDVPTLGRLAVIGEPAMWPRTQGGGSATVLPERIISPLDALREALPASVVDFAHGAEVSRSLVPLALSQMTNPVTGAPGARVQFMDASGHALFSDDRRSTRLVWFGADAPLSKSSSVVVSTVFTPDEDGEIAFGCATTTHVVMSIDGVVVVDDAPVVEGMDLGAAFIHPPVLSAIVQVRRGVPVTVSAAFAIGGEDALPLEALSVTVGTLPRPADPEMMLREAAELASTSDVAVVVVGTNDVVESEGYDRTDIDLPGRQNDLVAAVLEANPRTIVVVNAGSPVAMPWAERAAAVIVTYFGGQEFGTALADILTGVAEPGGRLPTTWPRVLEDAPVVDVVPQDGSLVYSEGIHVGYRAWLRAQTSPAFPFGHGLGYTTWTWDTVSRDRDSVLVHVRNTGTRRGKQVVQVYAERPHSAVERPVRWLVGFATVTAEPGETALCRIPLPPRRFAHWEGGWVLEPGEFMLRVGSSSQDLPLALSWSPAETMTAIPEGITPHA